MNASAPVIEYPYQVVSCDWCRGRIIWAITKNLRDMPVDADLDPDGNVVLTPQAGRKPIASVLGPAKRFGKKLRMPHAATCPRRGMWTAPKRRPL